MAVMTGKLSQPCHCPSFFCIIYLLPNKTHHLSSSTTPFLTQVPLQQALPAFYSTLWKTSEKLAPLDASPALQVVSSLEPHPALTLKQLNPGTNSCWQLTALSGVDTAEHGSPGRTFHSWLLEDHMSYYSTFEPQFLLETLGYFWPFPQRTASPECSWEESRDKRCDRKGSARILPLRQVLYWAGLSRGSR